MKNALLSIFFLSLFSFQAHGQNIEFDISPVIVETVSADEFDEVGYSMVTNTADVARDFDWVRNIIQIPEAWQVAICDKVQCWLPSRGTSSFDLLAGDSSIMDVHVYPNGVAGGCAIVEMTVTDQADESLSVSNLYYFNGCFTNTTEVSQQTIKVYPNPSSGLFSLQGDRSIAQVDILSLTGRLVKSFRHNAGQWYDISQLPQGTYMVRLVDQDAQQLVTKLINKF